MRRTSFRAITVATAAATLLAASITAATAGTAAGSDKPDVTGYAPGMVAAMERDLGPTTAQAVAGSPRPATGASAAKRSGSAAPQRQVAWPPRLSPVR